ncbi:MAG TPA: hypothetical protein VHA56_00915 [Mucilaginibacter sp.]|nr:hypothetical protein [Mucilaginibacter sp.]
MDTSFAISARSLQYYVMARKWFSDLEFFKIETAFFHRLIDENIKKLSDEGHIMQFLSTGKKLLKLENDESKTDNLLTEQLKQLELMAEDVIPEDVDALAATQIHLENFIANLMKEYRVIKQEIFHLIAAVKHEPSIAS